MAGVDLPTLKELMGHSDISTTMRYVHPTPEHKREAVLESWRITTESGICSSTNQGWGPHRSPHSRATA